MAIKQPASKQAILDRKIVADIINGDTKSFQKLMDRYHNIIYFTLLKMVYSPKVAEELTAEVFSKAFQNLSTYSEEYAFSTWLFTIANNKGIDYIRRKKAITITIEEEHKEDFESVALADDINLQPDALLMKQQIARELHNLVNGLKPLWKKLIEMRYFQELSYEEIAEIVDLPLGTIKNQLFRAKQKLAKLAEEKNIDN